VPLFGRGYVFPEVNPSAQPVGAVIEIVLPNEVRVLTPLRCSLAVVADQLVPRHSGRKLKRDDFSYHVSLLFARYRPEHFPYPWGSVTAWR
jgi:hypothetical protein